MTGRTTRLIERDARIKALAHDGKTAKEIASIEKIAVGAVYSSARAIGVKLKPGYRSSLTGDRQACAEKMVGMYRQGVTLQKIGDQFGVTRERVRQVICKQGVKSTDGGKSVVAAAQALAREQAKEAQSVAKYGLPHAVVQQLRKDRVTYAFQQQRRTALMRGIDWRLSFGQWFAIWQASGKLHLRGRAKGEYVMSRVSDAGCYEIGNVHIQLATENSKEAVKKWKGKNKTNRGVFCLYPGRDMAWFAKVGKVSLGYFKTEAEAVSARNAYLENHPKASSRGYAHIKGKEGRSDRYQVMVGKKYIGSYLTPDAALAARAAYIDSLAHTAATEAKEAA